MDAHILMSMTFFDAVEAAAKHLTLPGEKVFLKAPFEGFFVTLTKPEVIIFTERDIGGKKIYVVCESILGQKL